MDQDKFDEVFNRLTFRRKQVLQRLLAGERDEAIAQSLHISPKTVRKHIENVCRAFSLQNEPGEQFSKRPELKALFSQYKPECLANNTIGTPNKDEPAPAISPEPALTHEPVEFDLNFVGRDRAITELNSLVRQGAKVIVIQAAGGVGKTTLAQEYLKTQGFELVIELPMAKETENITAVESVIEEWLKQDFKEEPGREFGITLGRLKRQLQMRRVGILIDNLEPALDKQGKFIEPHRRYMELLRVLADSSVQSVTLITSRERLCEAGVTVEHYKLPGLDEPAWHLFLSKRNINIDTPTLKVMHNAYGGNAKAMRIFCGAIREDFDGDMAAYWRENGADLLVKGDLKDLITSQFKRLHEICLKAYRLLCRLGCFRYQDVPVVPTEGILCLLWDVPEAQRRRIIESLRNRSLVECRKVEYWLHPVIRAEAISRLRESEDWETANRIAAEFWTDSVKAIETVEDALTAFEAYYHYVEIKDFEDACKVIVIIRKSAYGDDESLGRCFYRFGLLDRMILPVHSLLQNKNIVQSSYGSELYNTLGAMYWLQGNVHQALEFYEIGRELAISFESRDFILLSLLNIALCKIDLWELSEALELFNTYNLLSEEYEKTLSLPRLFNHQFASWFCLALLNSLLNFKKQASYFAEKTYNNVSVGCNFTPWDRGYSLVFLGLTYKNIGNYEKSFEMYRRALAYAEESHYTQVKAKALYGFAELYREQVDFDTALSHHSEAIELLDKIGAKCDLAEAYYQLALTYQRMGKAENSEVNFQEAIRLYTEIEAPKQIEKVRQARGDQ